MTSSVRKPRYRRLCLGAVSLLAPLVLALGVAWACVPSSSMTVRADSGIPGTTVRVAANGFQPGQIQIRWDSPTGPVLKETTGPPFEAEVQIPSDARPGLHYVVTTGRSPNDGSPLSSTAVFWVTSPSVAVQPASGLGGGTTSVSGSGFAPGDVELRWDSPAGPLIGTANGPSFSSTVRIPAGAAGAHRIFAVGRGPAGESADVSSAAFQVTAAPPRSSLSPVSPLLSDTQGPAIVGSLAAANASRTVSRKGEFRLVCGKFMEAGVTGACSAKSLRRLVQVRATRGGGKTRRSVVLKVRSKRFAAQSGRSVLVKFRLSKSSLRMLKAAKRVGMRGTVTARDARENVTRETFRFTLKAPKRRGG